MNSTINNALDQQYLAVEVQIQKLVREASFAADCSNDPKLYEEIADGLDSIMGLLETMDTAYREAIYEDLSCRKLIHCIKDRILFRINKWRFKIHPFSSGESVRRRLPGIGC